MKLSFVKQTENTQDFWHVPATSDYLKAYAAGRGFACEYLSKIDQSNPTGVSLGLIIEAMSKHQRGTPEYGYQVGFLAVLEERLAESLIPA